MKPTDHEIERVVQDFGMLRFFPTGESEKLAVMLLLSRMVGSREELSWLSEQMINHVGEWMGPAELRGVYCAYGALTGVALRPGGWEPADGIRHVSTVAGYTQEDRNEAYDRLSGDMQMKYLATPEESVDNPLLEIAVKTIHRIPKPTAEDYAASRKLLAGVE